MAICATFDGILVEFIRLANTVLATQYGVDHPDVLMQSDSGAKNKKGTILKFRSLVCYLLAAEPNPAQGLRTRSGTFATWGAQG